MKTIEIGSLFPSLQEIEALKGKIKLEESTVKDLIAHFLALSGSEAAIFVTTTGQKAASVGWQTRATISAELLLAAGVTQSIIDACKAESKPFPVFRVN